MINFNFLVKRARVINEANLFNKEDLTSAVLREIHGESEAIQKWFKTKYINWYQSPDGDSSKNLQDYNWKEGDPNWAKPNPDQPDRKISIFKGLTANEKEEIADIILYLRLLPEKEVALKTYNDAITTARSPEHHAKTVTSAKWGPRVKKYKEQMLKILTDNFIEHLSKVKEYFLNGPFMKYVLDEDPSFDAEHGLSDYWKNLMPLLADYVKYAQAEDNAWEKGIEDIRPRDLIQLMTAANNLETEYRIENLEEGVDYVEIDPLFNYKPSDDNADEHRQFINIIKRNDYKFIRLISMQAFINEGERMNHCVKTNYVVNPQDHTLISVWRGISSTGDPKATMRFANAGKDIDHKTKKVNLKSLTKILECKGKGNVAPTTPKVQEVIRKFISLNGITITQDGANIGLKEFEGVFYDPDSRAWHQVWDIKIRPKQLRIQQEILAKIRNIN